MDQNILAILQGILSSEGGFVNNPADAGGPTNMGVTIPVLSQYLGRKASITDIMNLTVDQAEEIYYRMYFLAPRFDTLPVDVQPVATDTGVLYGTRWAIKTMQNICNQCGFGPIDADGILGPQSRATIETAYEKMGPFFIDAIVQERIDYSTARVASNPTQAQFLDGWVARAN